MIEERIKMKHFFDGEIITETDKLSYKLGEKLVKEYNEFMEKLVNSTVEDIIASSYEKVCKEEFVYLFEHQNLSAEEYKALLKCPNILNDCYNEWLGCDGALNEKLEYPLEQSIKNITNDYKEKTIKRNKESR